MYQALSANGIKDLFLSGSFNNKEIIVQLLSLDQLPNPQITLYEIIISDGFTKNKAVLVDQASNSINKEFSPVSIISNFKPIIKIISWKANEELCLIKEIEIVNKNYNTLIGNPINYKEFVKQNFQNKNGSSIIKIENPSSLNHVVENAPFITPLKKRKPNILIVEQSPESVRSLQTVENSSNQQGFQSTSQSKVAPSSQQKLFLNRSYMPHKIEKQNEQFSDTPISILHPMIVDFSIKARVISKTLKREFVKNGNMKSCVFSIDILDKEGSTITCAFFGNTCNKFFDLIEVGSIYQFSGGSIKTQQRKFSNTTSDYQIYFEEYSRIVKLEDDLTINKAYYNFYTIKQIKQMNVHDIVNVIGIVKDNTVSIIQNTKNGSTSLRSVYIFDQSENIIQVSLWGNLAEKNQLNKDDIVWFKSMLIKVFNGEKQLSSGLSGSLVFSNELQDIKEYINLVEWYKNVPQIQFKLDSQNESYMPLKYCDEIEEIILEELNKLEDLSNFKNVSRIRAFLVTLTSNQKFVYPACEKCNKKLTSENGVTWKCDSCNLEYPTPNYRFILFGKFSDMTGSIWLTIHDNIAQTLLEINANEFEKLDEVRKNEIIKKNNFKEYNLQILTKIENFQGMQKAKHQILKLVDDNFQAEVKELYNQLNS